MNLKSYLGVSGLSLALALGLAACASETKVYNTPSPESGTMSDTEMRTTTDRVHIVGEPDDPNDRDEDRVEIRSRTNREIRSGDRDRDVDIDIDHDHD